MATDSKARFLRDAEKFVLQGKTQQAINEYLKIVKSDPNDVLTMNTIGDLYLREGRIAEATKYFGQVAEHYTSNNFLLKAIAVYKKILNSDPNNSEINGVVAQLYLRQGLTVEARNQFMRIADHCAREGKSRESLEAYEKVAELDPANATVRLKLAETFLAEGSKDKAQLYFAGAARAQSKAGDHAAAARSFRRALELAPTDPELMRGYVETVIQTGDTGAAIGQIRQALEVVPLDIHLREMLGRTYLATGDLKSATEAFMALLAQDESQYRNFLALPKAFLEAGEVEEAARSLDPIASVLISNRATEQAIEAYNLILETHPDHESTLTRLADIYAATNNHLRYVEVLDRLIALELDKDNPGVALGFIEKILQINPRSEKHLKMHEEAFGRAFPGTEYAPPNVVVEAPAEAVTGFSLSLGHEAGSASGSQEGDAKFVEIDLLLNYGMKARALERLEALEGQDPANPEIRTRLLSLYKEARRYRDAAEQCILLAAIHRRARDEETARKCLAEAGKLAPEWVVPDFDVAAFAQARGIAIDRRKAAGSAPLPSQDDVLEIDLSEDISEVFFKDSPAPSLARGPAKAPSGGPEIGEEYAPGAAPRVPAAETLNDKLQEVDFYLRLGFHDEARAKLDEISAAHPGHPELESRYAQLSELPAPQAPAAENAPQAESLALAQQPEAPRAPESEVDLDAVVNRLVQEYFHAEPAPEAKASPPASGSSAPALCAPPPAPPPPAEASKAHVNAMFADVIEEVATLEAGESVRDEFETHFQMGVAYREMNLIDDAIREFEDAVRPLDARKHPREIMQCCGLLSTCYLEKSMPRSAVRWCQTGLNLTDISPHEGMALRYDMGVAHSLMGEAERALDCFGELFRIDPTYRDVAHKIDSLKSTPQRHGP